MAKRKPKLPKKYKSSQEIPIMSKEKPRITIDAETLPAIKDWKIDQEYQLVITARMTGINERTWEPDKGKIFADFEIEKAEENKKEEK